MQHQNNNYNKKLKENANQLRANMTKAEACLWKYALRAGMMNGYKFRRQRPIGWYIADFLCLELLLVIEVDGVTHLFEETQRKDMKKEAYLIGQGYRVLRFTDEEVLKKMTVVKQQIEMAIRVQEEELKLSCDNKDMSSP
ncbi:endonuclease domain-containing protein [Bacteroides sp. OttesenSCG-928-D19]|nr:endonuclease domain-containing protein [Bacteroides sp. OttesenSCG-928-N06]MDL2304080.1 endonuclease domain-containing protein [Bacteroides sp. OttesenSCG-928-D19]